MYFLPYILFFSVIFILSFRLTSGNAIALRCYSKTAEIYTLLLFFVFFGLRGYVYSDCLTYEVFFSNLPSFFDGIKKVLFSYKKNGFEPGFFWISVIVKTIFPDYLALQFTLAVINFLVLFKLFDTYVPNHKNLCFLVFFCYYGIITYFNLLRNCLAISCFIISIKEVECKNYLKYLAWNLFGALFHSSALVYIPLYFLLGKEYKRRHILFMFVFGLFVFLLRIRWLSVILASVAGHFSGHIVERIIRYMASEKFSASYGISFGFIERFINFVVVFWCSERLKRRNQYLNIILNIFYLYIFIWLYCSEMYILVQRLPLLFVFSYWIVLPSVFEVLGNENKKLFLIFVLSVGMMKIVKDNSNILMRYDNLLTGIQTVDERRHIFRKNIDIILGGAK